MGRDLGKRQDSVCSNPKGTAEGEGARRRVSVERLGPERGGCSLARRRVSALLWLLCSSRRQMLPFMRVCDALIIHGPARFGGDASLQVYANAGAESKSWWNWKAARWSRLQGFAASGEAWLRFHKSFTVAHKLLGCHRVCSVLEHTSKRTHKYMKRFFWLFPPWFNFSQLCKISCANSVFVTFIVR